MDAFAYRKFTEQTNLAKVQVGDHIYTTPKPVKGIVQLERPQYAAGIARQVADAVKGDGGRRLLFADGTTIVPRNGTAAAYRYLTDDNGQPLPNPTFPVCPTCGAAEDDPACHVTGKPSQWTAMHKTREKLLDQAPKPRQVVKRDGVLFIDGYVARGDEPRHEVTKQGHHVWVHADGRIEEVADPSIAGRETLPARTDAEADEALAGEPDDHPSERCSTCKGYGLVRKRGPRAGEKYRTLGGAQAALVNGNAVDCPKCKGTGELGLVA